MPLTPKSTAILWCLATRAKQLMTKADLLDAAWPETAVTEGALAASIRDLRRALDDDADRPRYIETIHRRGYRFLAAVSARTNRASTPRVERPLTLVGRDVELGQLTQAFERAREGRRQVVFVTGDAGIGKTTLVDAFATDLLRTGEVWLARGQCVEQYGSGEAYLPILDVLGDMCRGPGRESALSRLAHCAPGWLAELPGVLAPDQRAGLAERARGVTRDRMLRELAEVVEALAAERPLVWMLEDLQWSDASTVEALAMLARRRAPAQFMVVGTLRPVELIVRNHPLRSVKQELAVHGQCAEIALPYLSEPAIQHYLDRRYPKHSSRAATRFLYRRTLGLPLFMVTLAGYLAERAALDDSSERLSELEAEVPEGVQQFIEAQLSRLEPAERMTLDAAAAAGQEFTVAELAAALAADRDEIEAACDRLSRRGAFIGDAGVAEWPDGTVSGRYRFGHALSQEVLYRAIGSGKRVRLHLAIGTRLEAACATGPSEMAAVLAMHFERARLYERAVDYRHEAAQRALQHCGYDEADEHASRGLALLPHLPASPARARAELALCVDRGTALTQRTGYATTDAEQILLRASRLAEQVTDGPAVARALGGLWNVYLARAAFGPARQLADELLERATASGDPALLLYSHNVLGQTKHFSGDLIGAQPHVDGALALIAEIERRGDAAPGVDHDDLVPRGYGSQNRWLCGYPDQARRDVEAGIARAERSGVPFFMARMRWRATCVRQSCGDVALVEEEARALCRFCEREGLSYWLSGAAILHGWARGMREGSAATLPEMRVALEQWQATGMVLVRSYYLALIAEVCRISGRFEDGRAALTEALAAVEATGERWYEAEIHRGFGELAIASGAPRAEADAWLRRAADIARRQGALALELRAAMSLARLERLTIGRPAQDTRRLAMVHGQFAEGFDTADLQEARTLLEPLP